MPASHKAFSLAPNQIALIRDGLAAIAGLFPFACILDSCGLENTVFTFDNQNISILAGFGGTKNSAGRQILTENPESWAGKWHFGNLNYELKDKIEPGLNSAKMNPYGFPDDFFFEAEEVYKVTDQAIEIYSFNGASPEMLLDRLLHSSLPPYSIHHLQHFEFHQSRYLEKAAELHNHILRGDIYEVNYCIPFTGKATIHHLPSLWRKLNEFSPAPFSALYKHQDNWLLCASPERFLKKSGNRLYSQPIKGTARRGNNSKEDELISKALLASEKERAENIMITDLVRNDLSRIANRGTVEVNELCGLYSYRHVFQMISTISAEIKQGVNISDIIRALFPMGSMTGAPKYRAMQLIEKAEDFRRGIFSGSIGYISPEGDFDFNVVIRSIIYNTTNKELLIPAGSALTAIANHEAEYDECVLKASALLRLIHSEA